MRLKNYSRLPDDEVRSLVEFAMKGVRTERLQVHVKNAVNCAARGMAYEAPPSRSPVRKLATVDRLVTIGIGEDCRFPWAFIVRAADGTRHGYGGKRSPIIRYANWREALVGIAAHEARHIAQYQHNKPRSEVDAERYALKRLEVYRATLVAAVPA